MRLPPSFNKALLFLFTIGILAVSACSHSAKKEAGIADETATLVKVSYPVVNSQQALTFSGQIETVQSAGISTTVMGYITKIDVKVGDRVSKGQLLATISNDNLLAKRAQSDAMVTEAEAGYQNAEKDRERFAVLYKQQSASAKELDNINLQYGVAKARLEAAKQMRQEVNSTLHYTTLTAPFSGTITQKMMDAGSMANPGMPLLTIEQDGHYQASALVPESEIGLIRKGLAATVTIRAVNKVINGRITQISQSSANTGGQFVIKVSIPDEEKHGVFAGMYANLVVPVTAATKRIASDEQVIVPVSAIEYKDQLTGLYTVGSGHTALLRWVRLGKTEGDQVEVLSGLAATEQFIAWAEGRLYNGAAIKIRK